MTREQASMIEAREWKAWCAYRDAREPAASRREAWEKWLIYRDAEVAAADLSWIGDVDNGAPSGEGDAPRGGDVRTPQVLQLGSLLGRVSKDGAP